MCSGVLPGSSRLGLFGIEREIGGAVLQHHAGAAGDDRGAEDAIERMDQRRRVAFAVDGGDVDGVAGQAAVGRDAVPRQRARRIHQGAALVGIVLGDQPLHRHVGEARVGDMAVAVVIGELLGLHHQMHAVGPEERLAVQLERLEQVQHLEHGEALGRRRRLVDRDVAIAALDRLAPARGLRLEVVAA